MWCWRRMEKIIWTYRSRSEEVLHSVKEENNILHTINRKKGNWTGHMLRRNCLRIHVIEGKMERRREVMRKK
jgi:metal-responsive CopG/Arc/MetJ family transcriptional regulator